MAATGWPSYSTISGGKRRLVAADGRDVVLARNIAGGDRGDYAGAASARDEVELSDACMRRAGSAPAPLRSVPGTVGMSSR